MIIEKQKFSEQKKEFRNSLKNSEHRTTKTEKFIFENSLKNLNEYQIGFTEKWLRNSLTETIENTTLLDLINLVFSSSKNEVKDYTPKYLLKSSKYQKAKSLIRFCNYLQKVKSIYYYKPIKFSLSVKLPISKDIY